MYRRRPKDAGPLPEGVRKDTRYGTKHDRARHIAGHATLALAQGIDVELLTIEKPDSVIVDRDGARFIDEGTMLHILYHWSTSLFRQSKFAETLIRIALAGPCSEIVHRDEMCCVEVIQKDKIDWKLAWQTVKRLWSDENRGLDYLARKIKRVERFLQHDQYLASVGHISAALLQNGVLNGRRVKELYEQSTLCWV